MDNWKSVLSEFIKKGNGYQYFNCATDESIFGDSLSLACKEIYKLREKLEALQSDLDAYEGGSL